MRVFDIAAGRIARGTSALLAFGLLAGVSGCANSAPSEESTEVDSTAAVDMPSTVEIAERWISVADTIWDLDTPAFWPSGEGGGWVLVTGKGSHGIHLFDSETGDSLRIVGGPGSAEGEFQRPNGVVVDGDLAFVVERDNHRIQVLSLPELSTVTLLGADELERPYGLVTARSGDTIDLFVTDQYELEEGAPVPEGYYTRRVKHFTIDASNGGAVVTSTAVFGGADPPGVLTKTESIGLDPDLGLLLVAEEEELVLKEYTTGGDFNDAVVGEGLIAYEPEGIALYRCGAEGYWIVTDQHPERTLFLVLERVTYRHLGTFTGQVTGNTDGVSLTQVATDGFPAGAFFAVHNDQAVAAFDWRDIAGALDLRADCIVTQP